MRDEYDAIVIGAGPIGFLAARTAARECDVLLLEKRQEIGHQFGAQRQFSSALSWRTNKTVSSKPFIHAIKATT